jgi:hypothetical protein
VLAENMTWYIEWPHIDGRFMTLYATLPGYRYYENGMEEYELQQELEKQAE